MHHSSMCTDAELVPLGFLVVIFIVIVTVPPHHDCVSTPQLCQDVPSRLPFFLPRRFPPTSRCQHLLWLASPHRAQSLSALELFTFVILPPCFSVILQPRFRYVSPIIFGVVSPTCFAIFSKFSYDIISPLCFIVFSPLTSAIICPSCVLSFSCNPPS